VQYQSYVENPFWSKYDKDDGVGEDPFAAPVLSNHLAFFVDDSKNYATGDSIFHDCWLRLSYKSKLGQQLPHDTIKNVFRIVIAVVVMVWGWIKSSLMCLVNNTFEIEVIR